MLEPFLGSLDGVFTIFEEKLDYAEDFYVLGSVYTITFTVFLGVYFPKFRFPKTNQRGSQV